MSDERFMARKNYELIKFWEEWKEGDPDPMQAVIDSCEEVTDGVNVDGCDQCRDLKNYIRTVRFTLRRTQEIQTEWNCCMNCKHRSKPKGYLIGAYFCTVKEKDVDWRSTCSDYADVVTMEDLIEKHGKEKVESWGPWSDPPPTKEE
jgi:hypothetical protein